ncbi:CASP-like protein 4D1 isoform X1 [Cinnamomum micranthum f. kanehirae]|uniref:CASP-like protein n=1 Tax=Cinnamomum micranthum f. kanehirae TaxID=337451 RepID=A0A443PYU4_9MAGN|nr:CASP-like protein 4D1 isoform X1 [Cinnamomum micranthum f. kanehirae]
MASSKAMINSTLVLRFLTLLLLGASVVVLVIDKVTYSDGNKVTFKDVFAYRFVIATGIAGFVYTLFQIPFAIYHASTGKRLIRNNFLFEFDFYGDKVSSGHAFCFQILSFELKKEIPDFLAILTSLGAQGMDEVKSKLDKFFDRANIAIGILFLAFLCMVILSILSSINKAHNSRGLFG